MHQMIDHPSDRLEVHYELYNHKLHPWSSIRDEIIRIEKLQFGEHGYVEAELREEFESSDGTSILVMHNDAIVGFAVAIPLSEAYDSDFYPERLDRKQNIIDTSVYLSNIALHPDFTGKKLTGPLLVSLENELRKKEIQVLEIDALTKHNFADNIRKNNAHRILCQEAHDSEYGPQVFFRIKL